MVTSSENISKTVLKLPAIIICRELAFSDDTKDMSKLEEYLDNTLDLNYTIYNQESVFLDNHGARNDTFLDSNSTDFKIEYVYSYSNGLCYKFQFLKEVRL